MEIVFKPYIVLHIRDWISRPLWTKCHQNFIRCLTSIQAGS